MPLIGGRNSTRGVWRLVCQQLGRTPHGNASFDDTAGRNGTEHSPASVAKDVEMPRLTSAPCRGMLRSSIRIGRGVDPLFHDSLHILATTG